MSDAEREFDVVVLGGGPAGCAAAILLAGRAHRVALVRPTTPPAPALAESVPPSANRVLEELGALDAVVAAAFHRNRGNVVCWAGRRPRREDFAPDVEGFHTDRLSLERVLVSVAEQAGVRIFRETSCRSGERKGGSRAPGDGSGGGSGGSGPALEDGPGEASVKPEWELHCEEAGETLILRAPWVVDATGRRGVLARAHRRADRSTTTLALVRRWHRPGGWDDTESHHTVVESYATGWAWSVPLSSEVRCLTAMVDQRTADLDGAGTVDDMLDAELDRTGRIGRLRDGAVPDGSAWACPASLYTSERFAEPGLVLAGDAGSFIDPLSSFGVKKALSSGWLAGIVVHTALVDGDMAATAIDFFHRRESTVYRRYRGISADFFAAGADEYGTPYWTERADAARMSADDAASAHVHEDPDRLEPEVPESAVRAAFESIKARETFDAVVGQSVRFVERPAIEGHRIALQDHAASDAVPAGLRFTRGVDLKRLIEIAPRHHDVADGWAAYNAVAPPVTLPDYLTALSTAFAASLLEFAATPEAGGS
ncbi:MAG: tryptophan 7-halogenase [Gemmatimonadetes bacterium]|nr:tryptophan 7-halogenase [Gemmatimonadota bacterium]